MEVIGIKFPEKPQRGNRNWRESKAVYCGYCNAHRPCLLNEDGVYECNDCYDADYLQDWISYADSLLAIIEAQPTAVSSDIQIPVNVSLSKLIEDLMELQLKGYGDRRVSLSNGSIVLLTGK